MFLTLASATCLIIIGLTGFFGWDLLGTEGNQTEMLMPVFFGGALLICVAFGRQHYRHGLYGGVIIVILGIISAIIRIYQYEAFQSISDPKTRLILAMGGICFLQLMVFRKDVQKDRDKILTPS